MADAILFAGGPLAIGLVSVISILLCVPQPCKGAPVHIFPFFTQERRIRLLLPMVRRLILYLATHASYPMCLFSLYAGYPMCMARVRRHSFAVNADDIRRISCGEFGCVAAIIPYIRRKSCGEYDLHPRTR
jgi:hypothetical protein